MSKASDLSSFNTDGATFKNRLINGGMVIDQRNSGASVSTTITGDGATYTVDRWYYWVSVASKFTVQQNAGAVTPPTGYKNYLGMTSSSAYTVAVGETFNINQSIEGLNSYDLSWGTADAKTVTLSFWVRSSLTGTFGGGIRNSAENRSYVFSYTISSANTWEQKTITIAGDTTGTWLTTNGVGIKLMFSLGSGSTFTNAPGAWYAGNAFNPTGAINIVGTTGATFYITGVQFEKGTSATSFDYRPITTELLLCQRYYYIARSTADYTAFVNTRAYSTTNATGPFILPVGMRALPTLTVPTPYATYWSSYSITSIVIGQYTGDFRQINLNATGAYVGSTAACNIENGTGSGATAYMAFSAEL